LLPPQSIVASLELSRLAVWLRALRDFFAHRGPVRAASLSYTSLLALVPLLALVLSISKGVLRTQDPQALLQLIDRFLAYAVPQLQYLSADQADSARQDALARIQEAISRIDAGALGALGAVTLVTVGISLLSAIEHAFNDIWGVPRGRPLSRRIVYYWAGVTLGPVFLFLALGITGSNSVAAVLGHFPGGLATRIFWRFLPVVILSTGLTLLYWTMPNTHVPARAAVLGGVTAGVLLQLNNLGSALYFSQVLHYSKVYGGIGAIPVMMVGLYLSWLIVLYGGEVGHAAASPPVEAAPFPDGDAQRSRVALEIARALTSEYLTGRGGLSRLELADRLQFPDAWVGGALAMLCDAGLFVEATRDGADVEPPRFLPAKPPNQIAVLDVIAAVRRPSRDSTAIGEPTPAVADFLARLAAVERAQLGHLNLETFASAQSEP
jgi:membrane protein